MRVIGLTGGIASGKSTVSYMLRELGAEVIDADLVAKEVIEPGTDAWRELVSEFGPLILNRDRSINRRRLGRLVFGDPNRVKRLNALTHPRIVSRIAGRIAAARAAAAAAAPRGPGETRVLVVDAPLLIEAGMTALVDQVWVVVVDSDTQVKRLMARDHFTFQEALNRLSAQMPPEEKARLADVVIDNRGPVERTRAQVLDLWRGLVR
jgi:dephospho-CoA kinase